MFIIQGACQTGSKKVNNDQIWKQFIQGCDVEEIALEIGVSPKTVNRAIKKIPDVVWLKAESINEVKVVIIDATYWGCKCGEIVAIDAHSGKTLLTSRLKAKETIDDYRQILTNISKLGYIGIKAVVTDGRPGVKEVVEDFYGLKYQKCQFRQIRTIVKYLTSRPKLRPNKQLLAIARSITRVPKQMFTELLQTWYVTYEPWLNEATVLPSGKKQFVHRQTRSAYYSLMHNLDNLFVCRQLPQFHIPNTTNKLEGMFGNIKPIIAIHRGVHWDIKLKMFEYLCLKSR